DRGGTDELFALGRRSLGQVVPFGADTMRVGRQATKATIARRGKAYVLGLGVHGKPPESPGITAPVRTCAQGHPVAALRLDAPRLAAGLEDVSVFSAIR